MSLQNPTAYVTEERLNEYHNTILPYLGGMPDILANKFARGDMYSTDEKMIGRWIDGKPLYQKTVVFSSALDLKANGWTNTDIDSSNMDCIVSAKAIHNSCTAATGLRVGPTGTGNKVEIFNVSSISFSINRLTLQYTKTIDSPVEIGNDTDYSTTEKIIGTWIDGKPLYQKTISGLSASIPKLEWANSVANVSELNIKYLIDTKILRASGTGLMVYIPEEVTIQDGYIAVYGNNSTRTISTIIIQYTKTTD